MYTYSGGGYGNIVVFKLQRDMHNHILTPHNVLYFIYLVPTFTVNGELLMIWQRKINVFMLK